MTAVQLHQGGDQSLRDALKIESRPITLREQVLNKLRDAITTFQFKPGQRLVERTLCEMLGVSRTSVREALRHLEAEGLVDNVPHRGPIVSVVTPEQAQHLYQLRGTIEGLAARLFAERASDETMAELRKALAGVAAAFEAGEAVRTLAAVNDFYTVLLTGCENPLIERTIKTLHGRIVYLRAITTKRSARARASLEELSAILTAVEARDPVAAEQACKDHAEKACKAAIEDLAAELSIPPQAGDH
jgi:DNA-binding GntR family transcriptional regulator